MFLFFAVFAGILLSVLVFHVLVFLLHLLVKLSIIVAAVAISIWILSFVVHF